MGTGQLFKFAQECAVGDYVLYYDPPKKLVRICRVTSGLFRRDVDLAAEDDIWQCRKVEYPVKPIPILDFCGALKGRLLGPRMSFWEIGEGFEIVDRLAHGERPDKASDPEMEAAYARLSELILERAKNLDATDWEWLVADYFKAQGAHVDERHVGGTGAVIDVEARFHRGELPAGDDIWRVQVKRYQGREVDWPTIEKDFEHVGDAGHFCFVSVYGFTEEARARADEEDVLLLEAANFTKFLLSGRVRERIRVKLQLPDFDLGLTAD
jgi:predicted Mrr-cat superfamily restriction endonuclease